MEEENELCKIDFQTLVMSFASAAMMSLGRMPDPASGQICRNIVLARQNIDIIIMLKEKTKGNLTKEEEDLLDAVLYELRVDYIEALKG